MSNRGRPRTAIGTFGQIHLTEIAGRYRALTRYRDLDGRLRRVSATATSRRAAEALLKQRLAARTGFGAGGLLSVASPFGDLVELWLADLALRDVAGTPRTATATACGCTSGRSSRTTPWARSPPAAWSGS